MLILNFSIIKRILEQQLPKINQNRKMLMFLKKTNWTQLAKNISTMKYIEHVPWSEYWYLEGLQKYREGGMRLLFNYLFSKCKGEWQGIPRNCRYNTVLRHTGRTLCTKCSVNLKFYVWEYYMPGVLENIIVAQVRGDMYSPMLYKCEIPVFEGMFIFFRPLKFVLACWDSYLHYHNTYGHQIWKDGDFP